MLRFERPLYAKTQRNNRGDDGWFMYCPDCDDRSRRGGTLWITEGIEGRQSWHCFSCEAGFWELRDYAEDA